MLSLSFSTSPTSKAMREDSIRVWENYDVRAESCTWLLLPGSSIASSWCLQPPPWLSARHPALRPGWKSTNENHHRSSSLSIWSIVILLFRIFCDGAGAAAGGIAYSSIKNGTSPNLEPKCDCLLKALKWEFIFLPVAFSSSSVCRHDVCCCFSSTLRSLPGLQIRKCMLLSPL